MAEYYNSNMTNNPLQESRSDTHIEDTKDQENEFVLMANNSIYSLRYIEAELPSSNHNQAFSLAYANERAVQNIVKITERVIFRKFKNALIFHYINSLKAKPFHQRGLAQSLDSDWPFKQLHLKPNKSEQDIMMYEFINMCAKAIQAKFKGYLTRKRHLLAVHKIRQFKTRMASYLRGWKARHVFNCKKIMSVRLKNRELNEQLELEIMSPSQQLDRHTRKKKIQYLTHNIELNVQSFRNEFQRLYCGLWVFEIDDAYKRKIQMRYFSSKKVSVFGNLGGSRLALGSKNQTHGKMPREHRIRQFPPKLVQQEQRQGKPSNMTAFGYQGEQSSKLKERQIYEPPELERPIKAKGQYTIDSQELIKASQAQGQVQQEKVLKRDRQQEKRKHDKRKMYDPRKAIMEDKKRRKEQQKTQKLQQGEKHQQRKQKNALQESKNQEDKRQSQNEVQANKIQAECKHTKPKKPKTNTIQALQQEAGKAKSKKEKNKKPAAIEKKTIVNNCKAQSKVNCWNKRPITPKQDKNTYQEIHGIKKKNDSRADYIRQIRDYLRGESNEPQPIEQRKRAETLQPNQTYKQYYQRHQQNETQKNERIEEFQNSVQQLNNLRQNMNFRHQPYSKADLNQRAEKRKEVYRPIEQLQKTYQNQYMNRYHSKHGYNADLMPKLGLLEASRNAAVNNTLIPVHQIDQVVDQRELLQQFWGLTATLQRRYKDLIA